MLKCSIIGWKSASLWESPSKTENLKSPLASSCDKFCVKNNFKKDLENWLIGLNWNFCALLSNDNSISELTYFYMLVRLTREFISRVLCWWAWLREMFLRVVLEGRSTWRVCIKQGNFYLNSADTKLSKLQRLIWKFSAWCQASVAVTTRFSLFWDFT